MSTSERNLIWIGIITWLIVIGPTIAWQVERYGPAAPQTLAIIAALVAFLVFFLLRCRRDCSRAQEIVFLVLQAAAAFTCAGLQSNGFVHVLLVIVAGQLGKYPFRIAIAVCVAQAMILAIIVWRAHGAALPIASAYFAFFLFAAYTTHIAYSEAHARQQLAEANAELRMTSGLLDISSRTSERLRIARDLHDLLGHHLTALTLNLETASHLAGGEAREQIEKSKAIAKHLLADVRAVVSRLRDEEPVDLSAALESLRGVVDSPSLHLDVPRELAVTDAHVAQIALRSVQEIVTNAVRHSGARNLWVTLATADHALDIDARDDGAGTDHVRFGNGLRGIRERVEGVRGSLEVSSMRGRGFNVHVRLPLGGSEA
ncbi:MAG: histidine kinase [Acidobacteriota bacterium]